MFLIKIISTLLRLEWCINFLLKESLPVEILEPDVLLDLLRPVQAKPITWLSLQALVDEIGSFE